MRSTQHDLLITAAHCVIGNGDTMQFAPGYHDGKAPLGIWPVTAVYMDSRWLSGQDPRDDVAFLETGTIAKDGKQEPIQALTGANTISFTSPGRERVEVIGYPMMAGGSPIACASSTTLHAGFPTFLCKGFVGGTSGSPWLAHYHAAKGTGEVVGVIGGLHQGGCTNWRSYSPPLGPMIAQLYRRAESGASGVTAPPLGSDGCPSS